VTVEDGSVEAVHPLDFVRAGRWTRALFGTYALSLGFFEAAPLRALRRVGANDIRILSDVSGVAAALGEAGAREVGRTYTVDAVAVPAGCFHPKFILLDGEEGPRLLIGSGNLTFGGWGRNLELCEVLSPASAPAAFADMADFLEALAKTPRIDFPGSEVAASWSTALRRIGTPAGPGGLRVLHSVERPLAEQLVELAEAAGGATGLLVASPYFGGSGAVRALADRLGIDRVDVHVSTSLATAGRHYDFAGDTLARPVVVTGLDEGAAQRPMHAKLIEIACRDAVLMVSGSVNASGPALSRAANVELAVVRTRMTATPRMPFEGALPALPEIDVEPVAGNSSVLMAHLVGRKLTGMVMAGNAAGPWSARLDATGEFRELGLVEIGADRRFEVEVAGGDEIGFGTRRAVLSLSNGDRRIAGFVTFPDLIDLNRRFGAAAGSMLRVVGGSSEDEDMAGVLEYFARHPDDTAAPWSGSSRAVDAAAAVDDRVVSLGDLDVRPRENSPIGSAGGWGASSVDRLIAAVRRTVAGAGRGGPSRTGGGTADADADMDENGPGNAPPPPPPERTERVFQALSEAFASRIPTDPQTELHRLAELGLCVLARRPDATRFADYADWWCGLASAHLRCDAERVELRRLATLLFLVDAMNARSAARARRRIAAAAGDVDAAIEEAFAAVPPLLRVLVEEAGAGFAALDDFVDRVRGERSALEDLPALLAAIRGGIDPPPLPRLDGVPEMKQLRRRIAAGHAAKVPIAGVRGTSCPRCSIGMPDADIERLRAIGLVVAQNCCSTVVVLDRNL
jgi:hypothetical protein